MSILRRIKQTGWRYSIAIALNRVIPHWLFRCRRFVVYQLDNQVRESQKRNEDVSVSWCEIESDIEAVEKLTCFERSYSSGTAKACQARIEGHLAGGFWANTGQFDESEFGIRHILAHAQVWLYSARVDHPYRRKGVYTEILRFMIRALNEKGLTHQLVGVNPHNIGSNQVHLEHSFRSPGTVFAIRVFNVTVCLTFGEIKRSRSISWNRTRHPIEVWMPSVDAH